MRLRKEPVKVQKVRVLVVELHGSKVIATKSISCYDTNHTEVFAIVQKALQKAAKEI